MIVPSLHANLNERFWRLFLMLIYFCVCSGINIKLHNSVQSILDDGLIGSVERLLRGDWDQVNA